MAGSRQLVRLCAVAALSLQVRPVLALVDIHHELSRSSCSAQALATISTWIGKHTPTSWTRAMSPDPNARSFRAPTSTLGKWIEAAISKTGVKLTLYSQASTLTTDLKSGPGDGPCNATASLSAITARDPFGMNHRFHGFSILRDRDLASLIENGKSGVLYLWSPHKPISVLGLRQMKIAAKRLRVPLFAVVEPTSSPEATTRVANELGFKREQILYFDSFDLQNRGFRLHFPSLIVFDSSGFASQVRRGYEESDVYADYINYHLHRS